MLIFIDEPHRPPLVIDHNLQDSRGRALELYHPDPDRNFLKFPPLAVEVWLDVSHTGNLSVKKNFEPLKKQFQSGRVQNLMHHIIMPHNLHFISP